MAREKEDKNASFPAWLANDLDKASTTAKLWSAGEADHIAAKLPDSRAPSSVENIGLVVTNELAGLQIGTSSVSTTIRRAPLPDRE